jgi:hypothetical protein
MALPTSVARDTVRSTARTRYYACTNEEGFIDDRKRKVVLLLSPLSLSLLSLSLSLYMGRVGFDSRIFFPWMAGHPCLTLRARSLSLQGDPANIGKG